MNILGYLFFLSPIFPLMSSTNICLISRNCNNSSFDIRFPFYTNKDSTDCSNPGFKLSCTKQGLTSIKLPYSGEFLIRDINYRTQEIQIYDPNGCLAKRLLSFNLSDSVFKSPYYVELIFLTCPANLTISSYRSIDCLRNSKNLTLATSSWSHVISLINLCQTIGAFKIPASVPWPTYYGGDYMVATMVNQDIILTWKRPKCKKCEDDTGRGMGRQRTTIIALCITIPVIFFVIFLCLSLSITRLSRNLNTEEIITIPPNITPPTRGLDDSTIATYQQVTLGESKRLPGSGDGICVICLSEFFAKDTIRVIPECNHCFHTTCIDEWLRMRGCCPVCRNSPLPARVDT